MHWKKRRWVHTYKFSKLVTIICCEYRQYRIFSRCIIFSKKWLLSLMFTYNIRSFVILKTWLNFIKNDQKIVDVVVPNNETLCRKTLNYKFALIEYDVWNKATEWKTTTTTELIEILMFPMRCRLRFNLVE